MHSIPFSVNARVIFQSLRYYQQYRKYLQGALIKVGSLKFFFVLLCIIH